MARLLGWTRSTAKSRAPTVKSNSELFQGRFAKRGPAFFYLWSTLEKRRYANSCPTLGFRIALELVMSDSHPTKTPTIAPAESASSRKPSAKEIAWEKNTLEPTLAKSPERQSTFTTISAHPIRRLYTPADLPGWDPDIDLGQPGEPPYTRGIHT